MDIRLDGRRAIVTGAASGIGAAIAQSLSESGALVFLTDRNAAGLKTVAESLAGPSAQAVVDFMDDDAGERVVAAAVDAFGGVDIVINCAGVLETAPFGEMTATLFDRIMKINVRGAYTVTLAAFPYLSRGSAVVNIASGNSVLASPGGSAYATSKGALVSMTRGIAADLSPMGIRVNCICPGSVSGERIDRVIAAEAQKTGRSEADVRTEMTQISSLKSFISPQDIANMALFITSSAGARISGQDLTVDGHTETL